MPAISPDRASRSSTTLSERYALSPAEAATYIGCSRQTIYNLINAGKLPSGKVGRSRRIPRDALEALAHGGTA